MFLKRSFYIAIFTTAIIFAFTELSFAGIAVTPERHILELNPGDSGYVEYEVYNSGEKPIDIAIEPEELAKIEENKDIDINEWLSLKEDKIIVEAGKTKTIGVNVKVPEGAVGELDAMLYLRYRQDKESIIEIRYGTPLYVLIKGTESIKAQIKSVDVTTYTHPVSGQKRLVFSVDVANSGNRHIRPKVWAVINGVKKERTQKIVLDNPWPIFGGENYVYKIIWDNHNLEAGEYTCSAFFGYGEDNIEETATSFNINKEGMVEIKKE